MSRMSSGGDMALTATLSTQDVERALARLEGLTQQSAQRLAGIGDRLQRSFLGLNRLGFAAMAGVTGAYGMARKALLEYAEKNDEVKSKTETLGAVWGRVWDNIGRDVANSGVLEYLTDLGRAVEAFQNRTEGRTAGQLGKDAGRSVLQGHIAMLLGGPVGVAPMMAMYAKAADEGGAAIGAATSPDGDPAVLRRAQEEQGLRSTADRAMRLAVMQAAYEADRARGDLIAAAARNIDITRERSDQEANRLFPHPLLRPQRLAYVDLAVENARDEYRRAVEKSAEDARRQREDEEERRQRPLLDNERDVAERNARWERNRLGAEADAGFMERAARIALMRAEGREREAAAAALTLRYDRERRAVELDEGLSDYDKAPLLDAIERARRIEEHAMRLGAADRIVGARSLGGGLAGSGIESMVFGGGPKMNDAQRELLTVQKSAADTLKRIEQKIGAGAVYH